MEPDDIIEELRLATGWKDISHTGDSFVIRLDIGEMRCIKGLKVGNNCLHLEYDDFLHVPISFVVKVGTTVHQYWTLGKQMHRTNGRPAYVAFEPTNDRIIRRWFWNGLKHRVDGPAQEMVKSYKVVDIEGMSGFYQESWEYMHLEWYLEGFPAKFPFCSEAKLEAGFRIKNAKTNRIHSPRSDLAAFSVERGEFTWDNNSEDDAFRPVSAEIIDLSELYDDGVFTERQCSMCDINWRRGDSVYTSEEHSAFNEEFRTTMFPTLDLWGKFYRDEAEEFQTITEFKRIEEDQND